MRCHFHAQNVENFSGGVTCMLNICRLMQQERNLTCVQNVVRVFVTVTYLKNTFESIQVRSHTLVINAGRVLDRVAT
jgi:hypothetical protein